MEDGAMSLTKFIQKYNIGLSLVTLTKWFDRNIERLQDEDCILVLRGEKRISRRVTNEAKFLEILKRGV